MAFGTWSNRPQGEGASLGRGCRGHMVNHRNQDIKSKSGSPDNRAATTGVTRSVLVTPWGGGRRHPILREFSPPPRRAAASWPIFLSRLEPISKSHSRMHPRPHARSAGPEPAEGSSCSRSVVSPSPQGSGVGTTGSPGKATPRSVRISTPKAPFTVGNHRPRHSPEDLVLVPGGSDF